MTFMNWEECPEDLGDKSVEMFKLSAEVEIMSCTA